MPIGVMANVAAVLIGTLIGGGLRRMLPQRLAEELPKVFGVCSFTIGVVSVIGVQTLPMVIMAVILGFAIGELTNLSRHISGAFSGALEKLPFRISGDREEYMETYLLVVLMFAMSGTGLFGALTEGMSGDASVLLSKSVLDFFTAVLFGAVLGFAQVLVCPPQAAILTLCFLLAKAILPLVTPVMIADFKACGGLLTMVTGLSVSKILKVRAINLAPALVLVMPLVGLYGWLLSCLA